MTDLECRRRAAILASQLPSKPADAERVLAHMGVLARYIAAEVDMAPIHAKPAKAA